MDVRVGLWRRLITEELIGLNCGVGEDSWESLGLQGDPTSPFWRRSTLGVFRRNDAKAEPPVIWTPHAKSWLIGKDSHAGRDWGQEEKGTTEDKMASLTRWTWVWVNSGSWWWTGRPGVLRFMGSQRIGHDWVTKLNWCYSKCAVVETTTNWMWTKILKGIWWSNMGNNDIWQTFGFQ